MKRLLCAPRGARFRVYAWAEGADCQVESFLLDRSAQERKRVTRRLESAAHTWPAPLRNGEQCKKLDDNLFEFKAGQVRVLFFVDGRDIVVTNAFLKKQDRTPKTEIARAMRIRSLWAASIGGEL